MGTAKITLPVLLPQDDLVPSPGILWAQNNNQWLATTTQKTQPQHWFLLKREAQNKIPMVKRSR